METGVVKYDITEAEIAKMKDLYLCLKIDDLEDKEQFDAVHSARMVVKGKRVEVEKRRKELKASALEWGRKVDGKAKGIFTLLAPIESHLESEEKKVVDEQNRIKAEEEARQKAIIEARINELMKVNCIMSFPDVAVLSDEEFDTLLFDKTEDYKYEQARIAAEKEAEEKRKAEEAEKQRIENERLEQQRIEQEKKDAELKKQQKELEAQQKAIDDQKKATRLDMMLAAGFILENDEFFYDGFMDFTVSVDDIMKIPSLEFRGAVLCMKGEIEKQMKESAELAEKEREAEAKQKTEAEARDYALKKRLEAEEKARQEALKPDKEKINYWFERIENAVDEYPKVLDEDMALFVGNVREALGGYIVKQRDDLIL